MTTLSSVLLSGLSGLRAAQTAIGVASQNVTNANTPGYVRTEVNLSPRTQVGAGAGVDVTSVTRAANRFLDTASYIAEAANGSASVRSDILARAQANFGDPSSDTSMFGLLDSFWSAVNEISVDPSSSLRRDDAVSSLQATYSEVQRVAQSLNDLSNEADQRISIDVANAQDLINRISDMNNQIRLNKRTDADASAAENAQSALIDQLSTLMDVRVTPVAEGGVQLRTSGGALLVGVTPAKISYTPSDTSTGAHAVITLNASDGSQTNLEPFLKDGELKGLLQVRDTDLPNLQQALGGFAATLGDAINQVHNENSSTPAVSTLTGRDTGLLASDSLGFTGNAIIGVVDANGVLKDRLTVDFDAKTITSANSSTVYSFAADTVGGFTSALNSALGAATPAGSATFANGALTLNVGSGGGAVVQQDPSDPSSRAGRGFSHFFGLNDLVSSPTPMFFENGIKGTDLAGFNAGGAISYQVYDSAGRFIGNRTVTIAGSLASGTATMNDLVSALNATGTGLGEFGQFSINSTTGQVTFAGSSNYSVSLLSDTTQRGTTGISFTALNGLSTQSTAGRALSVNVNSTIASDPSRLAVGRPDLTSALGTQIIEGGDNRGSTALAAAKDSTRSFAAAGSLTAQTTTLAVYAARLGGEAGRMASDAQRSADGASAVATAASDRRSQVEGVNIDDELVKMTTFQNAYAAAARVIQAATEMMDVLINLGVSG
ncbi:MAG: flagellar hook-associated protein FlgK [Terricaulis sp.]